MSNRHALGRSDLDEANLHRDLDITSAIVLLLGLSLLLYENYKSFPINAKKTLWKRLTESVSVSALFLGLVLTFGSLKETFIIKPEADRINKLSQFNQAVNSAAKLRQETLKAQSDTNDPKLQLATLGNATPQIMNDLSTAKAMLRDLANEDIGISQLSILISESFATGDMESAKTFIQRAVDKKNVTIYEFSEAKRYEGKYFFAVGDPAKGRESFEAALTALGRLPMTSAARAFDLADLILMEYAFGDCSLADRDFGEFSALLNHPEIAPQSRLQLQQSVAGQLQSGHCPIPQLSSATK